jgi:peptide/nickel transport system permease protein
MVRNNTMKYQRIDVGAAKRLRAGVEPSRCSGRCAGRAAAGGAGGAGRPGGGPRKRSAQARRAVGTAEGMIAYIVRRLLYAIPILIGVNLLTFVLFFVVNTPDDMARMQLGVKRVTPEAIERWKAERGYDKPLLSTRRGEGAQADRHHLLQTSRCACSSLDFGRADDGRDIAREIRDRMGPSLAIALPTFILGLFVTVSFALLLVFFRATYLDFWGVVLCVAMMSISGLFYIIGGQWLCQQGVAAGADLGLRRRAGCRRFLILPVLIGVSPASARRALVPHDLPRGDRQGLRAHRARQGPVRAAVLFRHVLRNALIPILTGVVVVIPLLFMGSLLTESFFGIPGLGSYTIDAINAQDFAVVRSMVFIGSVLYIVGLILTDISYTLVDPRVRLQ